MPKVTVEFTLPDEQMEFDDAMNGRRAIMLLNDVWRRVRSQLKHGEPEGDRAVLEMIKADIADSGLGE